MTTVKGSKQYSYVVTPYRPYFRVVMLCVAVTLIALSVWGSFYFGHFKGTEKNQHAIDERDKLRIEVADMTRETSDLRQQVANLELGTQVDRKASEDVRQEVISLKARIAELQEDIAFYRGLMSPNDNKRGITIGELNVISTGAPRRYKYNLVIQQLATNHTIISGYLNFNVVGRLGEQKITYPLKDMSDQVNINNIKLRFKYFQNLEGELALPEGFEPERIELLVRSSGRNPITVEKKFGWLVQES